VLDAGVDIRLEVTSQPVGCARVGCLQRGDHLERAAVPTLDRRPQAAGSGRLGLVERDRQIERWDRRARSTGGCRSVLDPLPPLGVVARVREVGKPAVGESANAPLGSETGAGQPYRRTPTPRGCRREHKVVDPNVTSRVADRFPWGGPQFPHERDRF
jgi:hypothetical protein